MEIVHTAGYVHNDISLSKLMLGYGENIVFEKNCSECRSFKLKSLHLDDFSFATPYLDLTTGKHLKKGKADNEVINASNPLHSLRKLNCERTSRKDDLYMLVSLLLTLCNNYSLPDFDKLNKQLASGKQMLNLLKCYKESYSLKQMCKYTRRQNHGLEVFAEEVEKMTFSSQPNYKKLTQIMRSLSQY